MLIFTMHNSERVAKAARASGIKTVISKTDAPAAQILAFLKTYAKVSAAYSNCSGQNSSSAGSTLNSYSYGCCASTQQPAIGQERVVIPSEPDDEVTLLFDSISTGL